MIRAILFDAVGTLIVPQPPAWQVYAEVGRRFGSRMSSLEIRARFRSAFDREEVLDRRNGLRTDEARERRRWRTIVGATLDDVADPEGCFAALYDWFARSAAWRCEPDTGSVLTTLQRHGYRLALASNFDERLRAVVAGLPELAAVTTFVISSEVGWRKPASAFFNAACTALAEPPSRVLHIGDDRANDFDGARAAGLHALLLDPDSVASELGPRRLGSLGELLAPGRIESLSGLDS